MLSKIDTKKIIIGVFVPLIVGFIAWLFTVERSITTIRANQDSMVQNMSEMKVDIREMRKSFDEVLQRSFLAKESQNGGDSYPLKTGHF